MDTTSKAALSDITVCILNARDSTLLQFAYTGENGTFDFQDLPAGKFLLLVSYPDYADYVEDFTLDQQHVARDFGNINMKSKSTLLQEVIIKGHRQAITLKGDTTEFDARAFVIQPNDKVEDLLRKLPGIQVDRDGKITAQGQTVTKVLLDGEEFFGDDPTLITRNIRGDMVDKVQLYDKKSNQAEFTGIDDGIKTKTINIKLKEDKKNGTFGKAKAGVGTDKYYEGQGIYNRFKSNQKFSVYATAANDGKTGLSSADNNNIGSENVQIGDNGLINSSIGSDEMDSYYGKYEGNGNPTARNGGIHYDNKWNDGKQFINTTYQIGSIQVTGSNSSTTQQNLPTGLINSNTNQAFDNYSSRQKMKTAYRLMIDTTSNLRITMNGGMKKFRTNNNFQSISRDDNDTLINQQTRSVTNDGDQHAINLDVFYSKKFKKPRRTFSWDLNGSYNETQTKGYLNSEIDFYNSTGQIEQMENTDQYKTTDIVNSALSSNMEYSEPLSKTFSLLINYGLGINSSTADRSSFNRSADGSYDKLDPEYSSDYKFNQLINQLGAKVTYIKGKSWFSFGTTASAVGFDQVDQYTGDTYKRDFINWAPQLYYEYSFSSQRSLRFSYRGLNSQPAIEQLQPVRANNDPLNIVLGNPNLRPSFNNNLNLTYHLNNPGTSISMYLSATYSFTSDDITNDIAIDSQSGQATIQYNNLTGETPYNYSLYAEVSGRIGSTGIYWNATLRNEGDISYNYINRSLNTAKSYLYSGWFNLNKSKTDKYNFRMGFGPNYMVNEFSLQPQYSNNAGGFGSEASARLFLPWKFEIASNLYYTYKGSTQAFEAQGRTLLNADVSKALLKDSSLKLSLSVNDLLNQNRMFDRSMSAGTIRQSTFSGIKRYFMFSISWDFTKFGTLPTAN